MLVHDADGVLAEGDIVGAHARRAERVGHGTIVAEPAPGVEKSVLPHGTRRHVLRVVRLDAVGGGTYRRRADSVPPSDPGPA